MFRQHRSDTKGSCLLEFIANPVFFRFLTASDTMFVKLESRASRASKQTQRKTKTTKSFSFQGAPRGKLNIHGGKRILHIGPSHFFAFSYWTDGVFNTGPTTGPSITIKRGQKKPRLLHDVTSFSFAGSTDLSVARCTNMADFSSFMKSSIRFFQFYFFFFFVYFLRIIGAP